VNLDGRAKLYVFLSVLFVTSLVVGDLLGGKLVEVNLFGWPLAMPAGMIAFPVTFLLTDLVNEFYGRRAARFLTLVGFVMAVYTILLVNWAVALPRHTWTGDAFQASYRQIFGSSQRVLIASVTAYLVGQFLDIAVFHLLKVATKGRFLWLRATGSTVVSQFVDTIVVQALAFGSMLTLSNVFKVIFTAYILKLIIAILLTPLIYAGHAMVERWLGLEPVAVGEEA
jgi:uncharacterized integral membrane protein (TIGR00697 family)